jgi:uncharacterized membrane protein (TIGR02234 family)
MAEGRRTFGPVVLAGLASGVLAAVGGNRIWAVPDAGAAAILGMSPVGGAEAAGRMPLATALALVALACWGVLLVTRGRFRRAVSALGVLAAIGTLATTVVGFVTTPRDVRDELSSYGASDVGAHHTAWFWVTVVAALLASAAAVLAVRWVPAWPEMGSRYDAPVGGPVEPVADVEPEEQSSLDLWRAMDEGRDPTA